MVQPHSEESVREINFDESLETKTIAHHSQTEQTFQLIDSFRILAKKLHFLDSSLIEFGLKPVPAVLAVLNAVR